MAGERGFGLSLATQLIAGAMLGLVNAVEPGAYTANNSATVLAIDPNRFGGQWEALRNEICVWLEDLIAESAGDFRIPGQRYSELMAMKETASIEIPVEFETVFNHSL